MDNVTADYTIKDVIHDLSGDLLRYAQRKGFQDKLSFLRILQVLLTSPSFFAIIVCRLGVFKQYISQKHIRYIFGIMHYTAVYLSVILLKIQISGEPRIGPGLILSNKGQIILGVESMGSNCTISHHVTIGWGLGNQLGKTPKIGHHVIIGENSIINGPISIGDNSVILPNSVLSKSIPKNIKVGGNPAKLIKG